MATFSLMPPLSSFWKQVVSFSQLSNSTWQLVLLCNICGSHSGVAEDSVFWDMVLYCWVSDSQSFEGQVNNYSLTGRVSHPRRP
jgi:hypothetical protein